MADPPHLHHHLGSPGPFATVEILLHDAAEVVVGDTPHPAKRRWPDLREALHRAEAEVRREMMPGAPEPTPLERSRIKIADLLEMWEFGLEEVALGNMRGEAIVQNAGSAAMEMVEETEDLNRVTAYMREYQRWHTQIT
jgi:5'-deoxynucleotidase YfbR-like HD superfamily hydrolase